MCFCAALNGTPLAPEIAFLACHGVVCLDISQSAGWNRLVVNQGQPTTIGLSFTASRPRGSLFSFSLAVSRSHRQPPNPGGIGPDHVAGEGSDRSGLMGMGII